MRKHRYEPISTLALILALVTQTAFGAGETGFPNGIITNKARVGTFGTPDSKSVLDMVSTTKGFFPPRMTQAQRDAIASLGAGHKGLTVYNLDTLKYNQWNGSAWTVVGGGAGGLYEGGQNLISNNSFETDTTGWTASGGTFARTTTNGQFIPPGVAGGSWDSSAADQTLCFTATTINANDGLASRNAAVSIAARCASGTCTHLLYVTDGTNTLGSTTITSSTSQFARSTVNYINPASGTIQACLKSVASNEPALYHDDWYLGLAEGLNLSQVSQATFVGSSYFATTANCSWSRTNTAVGAYTADTDCPAPTIDSAVLGSWQTTDADLPQQTINSLPAGLYRVVATFSAGMGAADNSYWAISDGTSTRGQVSASFSSTGNVYPVAVEGWFNYTEPGNRTFAIHGGSSSSSTSIGNQSDGRVTRFLIERFPASNETLLAANANKLPTQQRFTSGSGTYTTPQGVSWLHVRMVGGGGGGSGSGTAGGTAAGDGGTTTFGSSLLTANGGTKGTWSGSVGGQGGSGTISSPAFGTATSGAVGNGAAFQGSSNAIQPISGAGAVSPFGGGAPGVSAGQVGQAAVSNTGSGGSGGGCTGATNNTWCGTGGGAGGYVDAIIVSPSPTYSYAVGAAGTAGGAGTSGFAGGAGAAGYIEVTEFYGSFYAPLILQGVTSPQNTTGSTVINNTVTKTSSYTATTSDETIIFTADGTLSLPAAANVPGKKYEIVTSGNGTDVTIDPNSTETVCTKTTIVVSGEGDSVEIQSNGTAWVGLKGSCYRTLSRAGNEGGNCTTGTCSDDWIWPLTGLSLTFTGAGQYAFNIPSGVYSATPGCATSASRNAATLCTPVGGQNATTIGIACYATTSGAAQNDNPNITCYGPR